MMKSLAPGVVCLVALLVVGSSSPAPAPDPLAALEQRLLSEQRETVEWEGSADGSVVARLHSHIEITAFDSGTISVTGTAGTAPADVHLSIGPAEITSGDKKFSLSGQAFLKNLWLSFVRIGFMHDANSLAQGGLQDIVQSAQSQEAESIHVHDLSIGRSVTGEGGEQLVPVRFSIDYGTSKNVGSATLFLSQITGLPVRRQQTVHFPNGDMRVTEHYRWP